MKERCRVNRRNHVAPLSHARPAIARAATLETKDLLAHIDDYLLKTVTVRK